MKLGRALFTLIILSFGFQSSAVFASTFGKLEEAFNQQAKVPAHKQIQGYWSGRCVEAGEKDKLYPAVYVAKTIQDPAEFPPYRASMSYFEEVSDVPALFDKFTPESVESYPAIKEWFLREQWRALTTEQGSLVNYYHSSETLKVQRAIRYFEDEFNKSLILRVAKVEGGVTTVARYCFFDKLLGAAAGVPITLAFGNTGAVANQEIHMTNPDPDTLLKEISMTNGEGGIKVKNCKIILVSGETLYGADFTLDSHEMALHYFKQDKKIIPFKAKEIRFTIEGSTSNIEVHGNKSTLDDAQESEGGVAVPYAL